jgi:uncharacterized protein
MADVVRTRPLPRHVRLLSLLDRRSRDGLPVGYQPDLVVPAADGSPLLTDHYAPLDGGEHPTLLVRTPYGRGFPWTSLYGATYARHGFHVVVQSCRGTGGSGGSFEWFRNEDVDGQATVDWLRTQPWFTGTLGMVGISYLGYAQWALAQDPPPELKALVIQAAGHDPYAGFYGTGAFGLETALIAGVAAVHQGHGSLPFLRAALRLRRHLTRVALTLPLIDSYVPAFGGRSPVFEDLLTNTDREDTFWKGKDLTAVVDAHSVPTAIVAGWYDVNLDQGLDDYRRLRTAGCPTRLLVGPWTHTSMLEAGGPAVVQDSLAWLRGYLLGEDSAPPREPVRVHVGGAHPDGTDPWRDFPDWPPAGVSDQAWRLTAAGALEPGPGAPASEAPIATIHYDPAAPTPSVGGPLLSRNAAGPQDNTALEARADVLTFSTEPLAAPVEVFGAVRADLCVELAGAASADIFARLCDVDERGRSTNVCDGLVRIGQGGPVTVPMSATAYRFAPGHRIRVQVSGGAHPRFARNLGTGEPLATATRMVPADITLLDGCLVHLPVAGAPAAASPDATAGR